MKDKIFKFKKCNISSLINKFKEIINNKVIRLINKFRRKYYFYVTYSFEYGNGSIFITSTSKNIVLKETCKIIREEGNLENKTIIITNFKRISKKFNEVNQSKI